VLLASVSFVMAARCSTEKVATFDVFERRDLDRGTRGELVRLRQEFDVDLVVVTAGAISRRQRRPDRGRGSKKTAAKRASAAPWTEAELK